MMNFAMQAGMNQVKSQAQNLIPKEVKDATNEDNNKSDDKSGNINQSNSSITNSSHISSVPKKKKSHIISKALAIKMYALLLIHAGIITIAEYIFHIINKKHNIFSSNKTAKLIYWVIFAVAMIAAFALSLMVSKIRCFSSLYFIYVLYIVLLALDLCIFILGGHLILFAIFATILIVFDAGSTTILIFCSFIKEPPSTFWIMCSSTGGIILAVFLCAKLYEDNRILVLVFGVYSFIIFQVMNYDTFDVKKKQKKKGQSALKEDESLIPSAMSLPYEFNASFIKMFIFAFQGVYFILKGCCTGDKKKK